MIDPDFTVRFSSAEWFGETRVITIGGVGTIGSWLSLLLARTGDHTLILYDDDKVETHNLSGQLYDKLAIDKYKVNATRSIIIEFSGHNGDQIISSQKRITENSSVSPVCFSCFDNMKARKDFFKAWKKLDNREVFIDGRMTIESYQVYTVTKGMEDAYEATLFSDADLPDQICSLKSTSHVGALIGGRMTSIFMNYLANVKNPESMRDVPFEWREDLEPLLVKIV